MSPGRVAVVLSGFPRRSETFAAHELLALDRAGLLGEVYATRRGDGLSPQPGTEALCERVGFLHSHGADSQAKELADRLERHAPAAIHAYFAHHPADVALRAARLLDVPFGFSTHARDARKISRGERARRAVAASCVVACNRDVAAEFGDAPASLVQIPHGVDTSRFRPEKPAAPGCDILAIGRLVPKKGLDVLIEAVAGLAGVHLGIVGAGPEESALRARAEALRLEQRVAWLGPASHAELPRLLSGAKVVAVPSVQDATGDRDGLPNVVLEALASGCAVVASDISAIPTAIVHARTGLLVPPGDPRALARALARALENPELRRGLGSEGRRHVEESFSLDQCGRRFAAVLGEAYGCS